MAAELNLTGMYSGFGRWMSWCKTHLLDPLSLTVMAWWWWNGTELMRFVTRILAREQTCLRHLQESCGIRFTRVDTLTNVPIGQTTLYLSLCLSWSLCQQNDTRYKDLIFRAVSCANITLISTLNRKRGSPWRFPSREKIRYLRLSHRWCWIVKSSGMLLRVDYLILFTSRLEIAILRNVGNLPTFWMIMIPSPSGCSSPVIPILWLLDPRDNGTKILRNVARSFETSETYRLSEWSWFPSPSGYNSPVIPFLWLLDPRDNGTKILRNVGRSFETSATYRLSEWSWFLLLLGIAVHLSLSLDCLTLKIMAPKSLETSATYQLSEWSWFLLLLDIAVQLSLFLDCLTLKIMAPKSLETSVDRSKRRQLTEWSWFLLVPYRAVQLILLLDCVTVKLRTQKSFETSVMFHQSTRCDILEDPNLQEQRYFCCSPAFNTVL